MGGVTSRRALLRGLAGLAGAALTGRHIRTSGARTRSRLNYELGVAIPAYAGKGGGILFAPTATMNDIINACVGANLGWLRIDVVVQQGAPGALNVYDWRAWEPTFTYARSLGMKILVVMHGQQTVDGAAPSQPRTSTARTNFASFAAAYVTHFGLGTRYQVDAIEIGNEVNTVRFWAPAPSMAEYGALLAAAYPAIKSARPDMPVISGGTGGVSGDPNDITDVNWYTAFYAGGWHAYCDAVAIHPYSNFTTTPGLNLEGNTDDIRAIMAAHGDGLKPLWGTESGAPTGGSYGVSQADQATILSNSWAWWKSNAGVRGPWIVYTMDDFAPVGASADAENYFGLRTYAGVNKTAYATVRGLR